MGNPETNTPPASDTQAGVEPPSGHAMAAVVWSWVSVKKVQWPVVSDTRAFRRAVAPRLAAGTSIVLGSSIALGMAHHRLVAPLLPLATGLLLVVVLWSHSRAERVARREEVLRSFAGMAVSHHGLVVRVLPEGSFLGEHDSLIEAKRTARDHGRWAVIVKAWGRYYTLIGTLEQRRSGTPVSFRTSAVADVEPAILDDVMSA